MGEVCCGPTPSVFCWGESLEKLNQRKQNKQITTPFQTLTTEWAVSQDFCKLRCKERSFQSSEEHWPSRVLVGRRGGRDRGASTRDSNGGANAGGQEAGLTGSRAGTRPTSGGRSGSVLVIWPVASQAAPGVWKASGTSVASIGSSGYNLITTEGNWSEFNCPKTYRSHLN